MFQLNFNATNVDPNGGFTCFPLGDYPFVVKAVTTKEAKTGGGNGFIEVTLEVTEGSYKGEVQLDRFNLWNSSDKAVKAAQGNLSALCHAIGRLQIVNDIDLIGGRGVAQFGPQEDNSQYSHVKKYRFGQSQQQMQQPTNAFNQQQQPVIQNVAFPQQQQTQPQPQPGFGQQQQQPFPQQSNNTFPQQTQQTQQPNFPNQPPTTNGSQQLPWIRQ